MDENNRNRDPDQKEVLFPEADTSARSDNAAPEEPIKAVPRRPTTDIEFDDDDPSSQDTAKPPADNPLMGAVGQIDRPKARPRNEETAERAPIRKGGPRGRGKKAPSALPALRAEMRPDTPALRAERVEAIRRDLVRRRRRKGSSLLVRLFICVVLPTLGVAYFLWEHAAPLYESQAVIRVLSAEASSTGGGGVLGGLFGGAASTIQDSVAVQKFILSRDVLARLQEDHGYITHFQADDATWPNVLDKDVKFEEAFDLYQRMTTVSFDPTEGVIELAIRATTPEDAKRFADAVIGYSEEMVDRLSDPIRENSLKDSSSNLQDAEDRLRKAQNDEATLREKLNVFSPEAEMQKEMQIIGGMEIELEERLGKLTNLRRITGENDPRVQRLRDEVETLLGQIGARQERLTGAQIDRSSLADISSQLQRATFETTIAMTMFAAANEAHALAKIEVTRQHRYLAMVDSPSLPDKAAYPKKFQTSALFLLIFLGAYILLSLTISVIREQASI